MPDEQENNASVVLPATMLLIRYGRDGVPFWRLTSMGLTKTGAIMYKISDAARRAALTVKTVRYYADIGLVKPAGRSAAGYRLYA